MTTAPDAGGAFDDLVERLTGRWAISVRGFIITVVLAVLGFVADLSALSLDEATVLFAALGSVFLINAVVNGVLHRTRWRNRHEQPVHIVEFIAVLVATGLLFATAFSAAERWFGLRTSIGLAEGFVVYPVLTIWIGSTVVLYLDVVDRAKAIRERAIEEHAMSVNLVNRAEEVAAELHRAVDDNVVAAFERIRRSAANDRSGLPEAIREVINGPVRATSHRLWEASDRSSTRIGIGEVLLSVVRRPQLRPVSIIGLSVVLPVVRDVDIVGWLTIVAAVAISLVLAAECWIANTAMGRLPHLRYVVLAATVLVFAVQSIIIQQESYRWGRTPADVGFVPVVILTFILVVITSMLGSYRDLDRQRAEYIGRLVKDDRMYAMAEARVVSEEARHLAGVLHGRVQSRLLGCAMALEFAGDDPNALRVALDRLDEVVAGEWRHDTGIQQRDRSLSSISDHWRGVADVVIEGNEIVDATALPSLLTVVEELVANSVRHGRARSVHVAISARELSYRVVVADDGGVTTVGAPGLGTAIVSRLGTRRQLSDDSGWTVEVEIPR